MMHGTIKIKKIKISIFIKMRPVEAEFLHADRHYEATSRTRVEMNRWR